MRTTAPEAPFTSDKKKPPKKPNTCVVLMLQAASMGCSQEGEQCHLIQVLVISEGYVRFRLKLVLQAILESEAILLQKISSGHQNDRSVLGLC